MDLDVDEPAAVRRRQRNVTRAATRFAVLALPGGQDDPIVPVGGQPDDLEPAVRVRHEQERAIGHPLGADIAAALAGDDLDAPVATSTSEIWEVSRSSSRWAMIAIRAPSGAQAKASTSIPASVRTVGRGGTGSFAGRPRRGTGASISQTWVQPRRRDRKAIRWPSGDQRGSRPRPGGRRPASGATVDLDDPDLLVAHVREAAAVGRPLRVGRGLV